MSILYPSPSVEPTYALSERPHNLEPNAHLRTPATLATAYLLADEFIAAALWGSVTARIVDANADRVGVRNEFGAKRGAPFAPTVFLSASASSDQQSSNVALLDILRPFYALLAQAPAEWSETATAPRSADQQRTNDRLGRSCPMRDLVSSAMTALGRMEALGVFTSLDLRRRSYDLRGVFKVILDGVHHCSSATSPPTFSGPIERRASPRIHFDKVVLIRFNNCCQKAVLRDISSTGFGLTQCPSIPIGQDIEVELPDGTLLSGPVKWSFGGNIGVQIAEIGRSPDRADVEYPGAQPRVNPLMSDAECRR